MAYKYKPLKEIKSSKEMKTKYGTLSEKLTEETRFAKGSTIPFWKSFWLIENRDCGNL